MVWAAIWGKLSAAGRFLKDHWKPALAALGAALVGLFFLFWRRAEKKAAVAEVKAEIGKLEGESSAKEALAEEALIAGAELAKEAQGETHAAEAAHEAAAVEKVAGDAAAKTTESQDAQALSDRANRSDLH